MEQLAHHGILNQKWGVRHGPPYPLGGGDYSAAQRKAIRNKRKSGNSIYNKPTKPLLVHCPMTVTAPRTPICSMLLITS